MISWNIRCIWLLSVLCMVAESQRSFAEDYIEFYRQARVFGRDLFGKTTSPGSRQFESAQKNGQLQKPFGPETSFPCNVTGGRSPKSPTSIHELRPGDIDIVAAMGDSLTAGVGATATILPHLQVENRGVSWSGGGQSTWREFTTLPNILKMFNPNLFGYAVADSLTIEKDSQFNVAESLAMSIDMPYMAEILVKRIKNDPRVDMQMHWKLVTIMIGGNDFCTDMCYKNPPRSVLKNHRDDLMSALRTLRDNLPRTLVSLVNGPNARALVEYKGRSMMCEVFADIECSCLFGLRWRDQREEFYDIIREWYDIEDEFPRMEEFQREDFGIVTQPFTRNLSLPTLPSGSIDFKYFSRDCFHLSQKGYARAANSVWNNLLEPVGKKTPYWENLFERFLCPTEERPYIATMGNS